MEPYEQADVKEEVDPRTPGEIVEAISGEIEKLEVALIHLSASDAQKLREIVKSGLLACLNQVKAVRLTAEELFEEQNK